MKFSTEGYNEEEIKTIKNKIENGNIRNQRDFNSWASHRSKEQRSYNSDSIDAENRATNADNDRLDLQTSERKSGRGQSNRNSQKNLGTGFIRVYNNDGTNGPRYIPINEDSELELYMTPFGEIYGFVDPQGNIYLDETVISPEHPVHEYTHLWDKIIAEKNPALWARGIELMKQTPLWGEVEEDPNYGGRWQELKESNPSRYEYLVASEVHAKITGKEGLELLDKVAKEKGAKNIIAKLKQWMLEVWKELKATFSNWSKDEIAKLTLNDFVQMTIRDFADGVDLSNTQSQQPALQEQQQTETPIDKAINSYKSMEYGRKFSKKIWNKCVLKSARILSSRFVLAVFCFFAIHRDKCGRII